MKTPEDMAASLTSEEDASVRYAVTEAIRRDRRLLAEELDGLLRHGRVRDIVSFSNDLKGRL